MYSEGRQRWPGVALPFDAFAEHCKRVLEVEHGAAKRYGADLFLCCACAFGIGGASDAFEREGGPIARAAIARIDRDPGFVAEVLQDLWCKLLVGPSAKVRGYSGKGPLRAWIKVSAARIALDRARARRVQPEVLRNLAIELAAGGPNPELGLIRARYGKKLQDALSRAIAALTPQERNILRMHVVGSCSIDQIGRAYDVHRATAARWLERIRKTIYRSARLELQSYHLDLTDSAFQSLARGLGTEVELSLFEPTERSGPGFLAMQTGRNG